MLPCWLKSKDRYDDRRLGNLHPSCITHHEKSSWLICERKNVNAITSPINDRSAQVSYSVTRQSELFPPRFISQSGWKTVDAITLECVIKLRHSLMIRDAFISYCVGAIYKWNPTRSCKSINMTVARRVGSPSPWCWIIIPHFNCPFCFGLCSQLLITMFFMSLLVTAHFKLWANLDNRTPAAAATHHFMLLSRTVSFC